MKHNSMKGYEVSVLESALIEDTLINCAEMLRSPEQDRETIAKAIEVVADALTARRRRATMNTATNKEN